MFNLITEDHSGKPQHRFVLQNLLDQNQGMVRIASAYVTDTRLLSGIKGRDIRLLTFLKRKDIVVGASSLDSLGTLIKRGVKCRYLTEGRRLHSKVYLFGNQSAVVTSANLTKNALDRNIEVGVQLSSAAATQLINWFDPLWNKAKPLTLATVSKWQRETEEERTRYSLQWKKTNRKPLIPAGPKPAILDLLMTGERFFVCNSNRVNSPEYEHETLMRDRGYAAAWEPFKEKTHMERVEEGDIILMFAKRVGIIAIGRAKGKCQILAPDDADRLMPGTPEWRELEWRIPTTWLAWSDSEKYCRWSQRATFLDATGEKYQGLRNGVEKHFLSAA